MNTKMVNDAVDAALERTAEIRKVLEKVKNTDLPLIEPIERIESMLIEVDSIATDIAAKHVRLDELLDDVGRTLVSSFDDTVLAAISVTQASTSGLPVVEVDPDVFRGVLEGVIDTLPISIELSNNVSAGMTIQVRCIEGDTTHSVCVRALHVLMDHGRQRKLAFDRPERDLRPFSSGACSAVRPFGVGVVEGEARDD